MLFEVVTFLDLLVLLRFLFRLDEQFNSKIVTLDLLQRFGHQIGACY